ncbi:hypothetical protein SAMN04488047_13925 [Tranquillimonas alkanivorans]|uniref:Uncharacterized protein n=1 Tax=Tranquillimonas alkanivorans TaxID=441119 RepID=A0A1I5W3E0_9RHOB|nr:hypothetical protein SAMN04488047_13925 [Tranquillimonas alkanivorans]
MGHDFSIQWLRRPDGPGASAVHRPSSLSFPRGIGLCQSGRGFSARSGSSERGRCEFLRCLGCRSVFAQRGDAARDPQLRGPCLRAACSARHICRRPRCRRNRCGRKPSSANSARVVSREGSLTAERMPGRPAARASCRHRGRVNGTVWQQSGRQRDSAANEKFQRDATSRQPVIRGRLLVARVVYELRYGGGECARLRLDGCPSPDPEHWGARGRRRSTSILKISAVTWPQTGQKRERQRVVVGQRLRAAFLPNV